MSTGAGHNRSPDPKTCVFPLIQPQGNEEIYRRFRSWTQGERSGHEEGWPVGLHASTHGLIDALDDIGMGRGRVARLGGIGIQVVEFDRKPAARKGLQTSAGCAVAGARCSGA